MIQSCLVLNVSYNKLKTISNLDNQTDLNKFFFEKTEKLITFFKR